MTLLKKSLALIVSAALMLCCFGCGDIQKQEREGADLQNETGTVIGLLALSSSTEEEINELMNDESNEEYRNYVFFDSLTDMQMALTGGKISKMNVGENCAKYMVAQDSNFKIVNKSIDLSTKYSMLLMEENQALCDDISAAIKKLQDDGTLDTLVKNYITAVVKGETPLEITLPEFEGADTITVAVTGDLPPMDYISVSGTPAGFNMALLEAISKVLQVNIDVIQVQSGARAATLSSGKADVIFWSSALEEAGEILDDLDKPESTIVTESYFAEKKVDVEYDK